MSCTHRVITLFRKINFSKNLWSRLELNQHPRIFSPLHRPPLLLLQLCCRKRIRTRFNVLARISIVLPIVNYPTICGRWDRIELSTSLSGSALTNWATHFRLLVGTTGIEPVSTPFQGIAKPSQLSPHLSSGVSLILTTPDSIATIFNMSRSL